LLGVSVEVTNAQFAHPGVGPSFSTWTRSSSLDDRDEDIFGIAARCRGDQCAGELAGVGTA
jgi:hypothetical protein